MTREELLAAEIPLRLAITSPKGPVIVPLWFMWEDERFWCAVHAGSTVARALERHPEVAFDLSTNDIPYAGLRGRGRASLHPERGGEMLERLIDRYLRTRAHPLARWLLSRRDEEVAIAIESTWQTHWDYSKRMAGL